MYREPEEEIDLNKIVAEPETHWVRGEVNGSIYTICRNTGEFSKETLLLKTNNTYETIRFTDDFTIPAGYEVRLCYKQDINKSVEFANLDIYGTISAVQNCDNDMISESSDSTIRIHSGGNIANRANIALDGKIIAEDCSISAIFCFNSKLEIVAESDNPFVSLTRSYPSIPSTPKYGLSTWAIAI